jgi:hypothetical protein
MTTRAALGALTVILMLVACGPSELEKQRLAFEQQKYKDEQAAKAEAEHKDEIDKQEQTDRWKACRITADDEYDADLKNWGEPVPGKPGMRAGPATQLEDMKNRLQRQKEECDRNFPRGISW